jgi:hypothetical protein
MLGHPHRQLISVLSICLLVGFTGLTAAWAEADCTKFVVMDTEDSLSESYWLTRIQRVYCSNELRRREDAENAGISAGIIMPIAKGILDLELRGHYSRESWDEWQRAFCDVNRTDTETYKRVVSHTSKLSKESARMVTECLGKPGLHAYIVPGKSRKSLVFHVSYKAYREERTESLSYSFQPPALKASCDSTELAALIATGLGNQEARAVHCAWDPTRPFSVLINSSLGPALADLAADPELRPNTAFVLRAVDESELLPQPHPDPCGAQIVPLRDRVGRLNLARLRSVRISASSSHQARPVTMLNDGFYDDCRSWIAADGQQSAEITLDLGNTYIIQNIALTNLYHPFASSTGRDRFISAATVWAGDTKEDLDLIPVALPDVRPGQDPNLAGRKEWDTGDIRARIIRIRIERTLDGNPARIDEIEVYGTQRVVRE